MRRTSSVRARVRQVITFGLQARQLDKRGHRVVLFPVARRVTDGRGFGEVFQHRPLALEDDQRVARELQFGERLPDLVKDAIGAHGDLPANDIGIRALRPVPAPPVCRGPAAPAPS